jgi:hypothetical protein
MLGKTLLYFPSSEIVSFIAHHRIDWDNRELARRGGVGDHAGITPTPAVEEFLDLLISRQALFTQREYMEHCWSKWREWITPKSKEHKLGVRAKLYGNFYPAMIDSLHVWAMLCESGMFDACILNSTEDAVGKSDLIVRSKNRTVRIALLGPTSRAQEDRQYKIAHRNNGAASDCVEIVMPEEYERDPGNKRWFKRSDIMSALMSIPAPAQAVPA